MSQATQSIPLIDGQDNFELIRDTIAQFLAAESAAQVVLATAAGKPNPSDWAFDTYIERINPWEAFRDGASTTPIVNIWYDNATLEEGASNTSTRQRHRSRFNVDIYAYSETAETLTGHTPGDEAAAVLTHHTIRLVRNILMHDKYTYLGLRGTVSQRWLGAITAFQPQSGGQAIQHVVAARIALDVDHIEVIDLEDHETLAVTNIKFYHEPGGKLIAELEFEE